MGQIWDDFKTLLFKHALLRSGQLKDVAADVLPRYLRALWLTTAASAIALAVFFALLLAAAALDIRAAWFYIALLLGVVTVLLALTLVASPIYLLLRTGYDGSFRVAMSSWLRLGGGIVFGALIVVQVFYMFRLWQSPESILKSLVILMSLGLAVAFGWLTISDKFRSFLVAKLLLALFVIGVTARFPVISELTDWAGRNFVNSVYTVTRPLPGQFHPNSSQELQGAFVNQGTREFLLWYDRTGSGDYRFYQGPGYNEFGGPFEHADTREELDALLAWQEAQDVKRERERVAAQRVAEAEHAAAEKAAAAEQQLAAQRAVEHAREQERFRLASYVSSLPEQKVQYVVASADSAGNAMTDLTSAITRNFLSNNIAASGSVLTDAFVSPDGFDAFAAGRAQSDISALRLSEAAESLLLIKMGAPTVKNSSRVSTVVTYTAPLTIALVSTESGEKSATYTLNDVSGAGVNADTARLAFLERSAEQVTILLTQR